MGRVALTAQEEGPNTPGAIGMGATGFSLSDACGDAESVTTGKLLEPLGLVRSATVDDYEALVGEAETRFREWRTRPAPRRAEVVRRLPAGMAAQAGSGGSISQGPSLPTELLPQAAATRWSRPSTPCCRPRPPERGPARHSRP